MQIKLDTCEFTGECAVLRMYLSEGEFERIYARVRAHTEALDYFESDGVDDCYVGEMTLDGRRVVITTRCDGGDIVVSMDKRESKEAELMDLFELLEMNVAHMWIDFVPFMKVLMGKG